MIAWSDAVAPAPKFYITKHALRRFRERLKLPARAARRAVSRAWVEGLNVDDLHPHAQAKLRSQQQRYDPMDHGLVKIWRGYVFVFSKRTSAFLTVYTINIPDEHAWVISNEQ